MTASFFHTVFWRVSGTLSGAVTGLLTLRLLGEYLVPARFDVVGVALQVMLYLPLLDLGFRTTLNRRLLVEHAPERRQRLLDFGQALYVRVGLVMLGVALGLMGLYSLTATARQAGEPLAFFLALGTAGAAYVFSGAQAGLLVGLGEQRRVFALNAAAAWVNLLVLWLVLRAGGDLWSFPLGLGAMALVQLGPAWLWCRAKEPGLRWLGGGAGTEFRALFAELKPDALACLRSQFAIFLLFSVDVVLVGLLAGNPGVPAMYVILARVFSIARNTLQAGGEALWPLVARESAGGESRVGHGDWLLRINAWLYGGAMGTMAVTLAPFVPWFMKPAWALDTVLVVLLAARFLITGLSSPTAYFLLGLGDFRSLARYCERELVAACVLALPLGMVWGVRGVAVAFLLATALGTFTPIFWKWARLRGLAPGRLFLGVWARGLAAVGISAGLSLLCLARGAAGIWVVAAGAAGFAVAALAGAGFAWVRVGGRAGLSRAKLADMLRAF